MAGETDLQIVGTSHLPTFANGRAADGVEFDVRVPFYIGSGDASKIVLSWLNWSPYSNSETPSPYTVDQVSIEKDGGGWAPVTFDGGARSKLIAPHANDVQTDAVRPGDGSLGQTVFQQGDLYWVRFHGHVAATGDNLPYMWAPIDQSGAGGAGMWSYSAGTRAEIDGAGPFANLAGKVFSPFAPAPVVLGEFTAPAQSYFGLGDSILLGTGEAAPAATLGTRGFFERAMMDAHQAYLTYAVSGISAGQVAGYTPWAAYAKYATTAVEELGVNDVAAGAPAIEARLASIWQTLRAAGVETILRTDIPPSTSSTDAWASAQNQSYREGFGPGSTMEAVRAWLAAQVGTGIDGLLSLDAIRDPADPWKYAADGQGFHFTTDGGHPNSAANQALAQALAGWLVGQGPPHGSLEDAFERIFRFDPGPDPDFHRISAQLTTGAIGEADAVQALVHLADDSTSVATLTYQFFTGATPTAQGLEYLISPAGPNPNGLEGPYYQAFNLENRYINFAVNLGARGEARPGFASAYGGLSLLDTAAKAYTAVFGAVPDQAKLHALVDGRIAYFSAFGGDGPEGLGAKAALVGWLLAEAVKADIGPYAKANEAYLTDLAEGGAYRVDIIGTYAAASAELDGGLT